jgi:hypothetical protein
MLTLPTSLRVFAKTGPTDMRKSFEGLVGAVERELGQQVESGDLFLFFNRRGDRVKVLWFSGDGRIPIDNNVIERLLRPIAIGRKNYLFFGSEKGGKTAATLYTLVHSARRSCVDVWPYLTDVLRRLPAIDPIDIAALEAMLPDR